MGAGAQPDWASAQIDEGEGRRPRARRGPAAGRWKAVDGRGAERGKAATAEAARAEAGRNSGSERPR
jgi:hypothetical protein